MQVQGAALSPTLQGVFELLLARRTVDRGGYIRYDHWRVYGEEGLAGRRAGVWLAKETHTLTLAYDGLPVTQYAVTFAATGGAGSKGQKGGKGRKQIEHLRERYTFPSNSRPRTGASGMQRP